MTELCCNLCGGPLSARFCEVLDPQTHETFSICTCPACKLGHTSPLVEDLSPYYGSTYHGNRHGFTAGYRAKRRLRIVESLTGPGKGQTILDVGCGEGTFLSTATRSGWRAFGTEMSPHPNVAHLKVLETIHEATQFGPFDCITLWHSLEHLRDPHDVIRTLSKLLKPEGLLVIAVPNAGGLQARVFGAHWFHLDVPRHLYHFEERSLRHVLELARLQLVEHWDQEFEYDLLGWSQSALNIVMPVPNVFYHRLVGKPTGVSRSVASLNLILGLLISAAALPAVLLGTLSRRGGTLILAAKR